MHIYKPYIYQKAIIPEKRRVLVCYMEAIKPLNVFIVYEHLVEYDTEQHENDLNWVVIH